MIDYEKLRDLARRLALTLRYETIWTHGPDNEIAIAILREARDCLNIQSELKDVSSTKHPLRIETACS